MADTVGQYDMSVPDIALGFRREGTIAYPLWYFQRQPVLFQPDSRSLVVVPHARAQYKGYCIVAEPKGRIAYPHRSTDEGMRLWQE
eukprot:2355507-Rhodomonas_salina.3